jgi:hypothetical protein
MPGRMRAVRRRCGLGTLACLALAAAQPTPASERTHAARVVDARTGLPIEGATVTAGGAPVTTDAAGWFEIDAESAMLRVRAIGYERKDVEAAALTGATPQVALRPFAPKALYLSFYGVGSAPLRSEALRLIESTELNALVIDVKSDYGKIPYESAIPLAAEVGAQRPRTISDVRTWMRSLRERGIYAIARIVVFKDELLAQARPGLAVKTRGGSVWRDRERLAWTDPFREEVWEYNLQVAEEAAAYGFDEIQFDYVRFPDAPGLVFAQPATTAGRTRAIVGYLGRARERLAPYNVFLAADVFGYVCWNRDDTAIGQRLEDLPAALDFISPMLYPSSFQFGIPGYRNPVAHPQEIVYRSLEEARQRTGLPPARFRPWLQAFGDYGFDRRPFGGREIRAQIDAAEKFGANGWMLWNPHNVYASSGLREE